MRYPQWLAVIALAGLNLTAAADVSLVGRSSMTVMNMPNQGREALYVHKRLLRRDLMERGRAYSYLYDLGKRELAVLDHSLRQATIHTLALPAGNARMRAETKGLSLEVKPVGHLIALQHLQCEEHTLKASMPTLMGQERATIHLGGQVWLARQAEEYKEFKPFVQGLEANDFFMGIPESAQSGESQAHMVNAVMRRLGPMGLVCAAEVQVNYSGDGPMARMGSRMATRLTLTFESINTQTLAEAAFEIPANYRIQRE